MKEKLKRIIAIILSITFASLQILQTAEVLANVIQEEYSETASSELMTSNNSIKTRMRIQERLFWYNADKTQLSLRYTLSRNQSYMTYQTDYKSDYLVYVDLEYTYDEVAEYVEAIFEANKDNRVGFVITNGHSPLVIEYSNDKEALLTELEVAFSAERTFLTSNGLSGIAALYSQYMGDYLPHNVTHKTIVYLGYDNNNKTAYTDNLIKVLSSMADMTFSAGAVGVAGSEYLDQERKVKNYTTISEAIVDKYYDLKAVVSFDLDFNLDDYIIISNNAVGTNEIIDYEYEIILEVKDKTLTLGEMYKDIFAKPPTITIDDNVHELAHLEQSRIGYLLAYDGGALDGEYPEDKIYIDNTFVSFENRAIVNDGKVLNGYRINGGDEIVSGSGFYIKENTELTPIYTDLDPLLSTDEITPFTEGVPIQRLILADYLSSELRINATSIKTINIGDYIPPHTAKDISEEKNETAKLWVEGALSSGYSNQRAASAGSSEQLRECDSMRQGSSQRRCVCAAGTCG